MGDRSDEVTESRDTEDLLEETEQLLSESGVEAESPSRDRSDAPPDAAVPDEPTDTDTDSWWRSTDESAAARSETESGASRRSRLASWLSVDNYFSPKAFLAFVLLTGAGLFAGAMAIPVAGRIVGMFAVAFLVGLFTAQRRYLEMTAAGTAVGAVSAVASNAFLAVAGSFQAVVAVGVGVGLVACLAGYYFGRDLRNGLSRDVE